MSVCHVSTNTRAFPAAETLNCKFETASKLMLIDGSPQSKEVSGLNLHLEARGVGTYRPSEWLHSLIENTVVQPYSSAGMRGGRGVCAKKGVLWL